MKSNVKGLKNKLKKENVEGPFDQKNKYFMRKGRISFLKSSWQQLVAIKVKQFIAK